MNLTSHAKSMVTAGMVLLCQAAMAEMVSINVGYDSTGEAVIAPTNMAGAVPALYWNNFLGDLGSGNPSAAAGTLTNNAGAVVDDMTVAFQGFNNSFNWNSPDASHTMFSSFLSGLPMSVTISNMPYGIYDVYVYYNGFVNSNVLTWALTDIEEEEVLETAYSARGQVNSLIMYDSAGFVQSKYETLEEAEEAVATDNGGNYVAFNNLTAPHISIEKIEGNTELGFTGIQIVEVIPEPGLIGFAFIAAAGWVIRRKR